MNYISKIKVGNTVYDIKAATGGSDTTYQLSVNGTTNGDSTNGVSLGTIYAPTTAGSSGQVLTSTGGVPTWTTAQVQSDWNLTDSTALDYIKNKPVINSSSSPIYLGECNSEASAQVKVATVDSSFTLREGVIVSIKYTNTNTYSATEEDPVLLNVNDSGPKHIYYTNTVDPTGVNTTVFGYAGYYITYIYDGTNWIWLSHSSDNNTTYSAGTAALLKAGTNTTDRVWQPKILHDYMSYPNLIYDLGTQSTSGAVTIDGSVPLHVITCTGNVTGVSLSTNPPAGHSCHVIFTATAARTVAIAHNATARKCPEATNLSLSIKANGYVEVDFININNVIYVRGV